MRFPGNSGRPGAVSPFMIENIWDGFGNNTSLSFDVWFALLPAGFDLGPMNHSRRAYTPLDAIGGILLGAQSLDITHPGMSDVAVQIAHVDPLGNLYCSFITGNKPVLATLQLHRWYHLALTVEITTPEVTHNHQCVYLDGKLVNERHGSLPDSAALQHIQIGNGVMDVGSVGNVRAEYQGKYGFNGLVDEFRFWSGVLSQDDIQYLRLGNETKASMHGRVECDWSLTSLSGTYDFYGSLSAVRCTRPMEGSCESIRFAHRLLVSDDPGRIHVDRF